MLSASLERRATLVAALLTVIMLLYGAALTLRSAPEQDWVVVTRSVASEHKDAALYDAISTRMAKGEDYYHAAAIEQRQRNYPLKPFVTMRLPTLAVLRAHIGVDNNTNNIIGLIAIIAITLGWWARLRRGAKLPLLQAIGAIILLMSGLLSFMAGNMLALHEIWAGGLMALALAFYKPERPMVAFICAALAVAIRETALPLILLFGAWAVFNRRFKEAGAWATLAGAFLVGLAFHAQAVDAVTVASDPRSPGWGALGGWKSYLTFMHDTTILRFFPLIVTALLVPLSLFGWSGAKAFKSWLILLFHAGYALLFMVVGRPDNFYWGFLVAPTLLMGLAFLPAAVRQTRDYWTGQQVNG